MKYDFIFCPLCGSSKWSVDKTGGNVTYGQFTKHKCAGCSKFVYVNITFSVEHPTLKDISNTERFEVSAFIEPYFVRVNYWDNWTEICDSDGILLLKLNQVVTFNWYKNEELANKIKKYVVFS